MKLSCRLAMLSAFLLVCTCTYIVSAQSPAPGGCNPIVPTTDGLITGVGKTGVIPNVQATSGEFRLQVGGQSVTPWTLWSETDIRLHGLWCQVNSANNAGMGSDIGDMFYPTGNGPDGFTVVPTSGTNNVPYQQFKCTNQIGMVVDGDTANFQGVLKCSTTIPNLNTNTHYSVMYQQSVISIYSAQGLIVDSTMTLSVLSSRDADIALSFTVSFGPPSRIACTRGSSELLNIRDDPRLTREVIRSRYISTTEPDMTRVTVRLDTQPRVGATYTCTVYVESRGRTFLESDTGLEIVPVKDKSTTLTVTVAGTPTAVTVTRTAATNVIVSWTAPASGPTLGGYEVFYQTAAGSNGSSTTTTTELTLTGLMLGQTYSIFVVAFGTGGAPVLPSAHSDTEMITLTIQPTGVTLTPAISSIMVSWTAPQFITPNNYSVSINCTRLCDNVLTISGVQSVPNGGVTSHTITPLNPGNICTVRVAAVLGSTSSESAGVTTTTLTEAPNGAPGGLNNTSVESSSLTVQWGTVPCPDQRGPITGYRLRYSNGTSIVDTTGEGSRQHVLTGLTPFTSYSVEVAAVNAGGTGPYSTALTVETLQDIPGPVSGLSATPGVVQLTISWSPPSEPNGRITMYQISYSTGVEYNTTSATQHILTDLTPNTVVVFTVRAYTIIGPGENVTNQASTTSVPPVTGVRAVALNNTAVNVSWTPVTIQERDHIFTIHYTVVGGKKRQSSSGTVNVTAGSSSGVVGGLMTGEQYRFSVSVTVSGSGRTYTGPVSNLSDPITVRAPSNDNGGVVAAVVVVLLLLIVVAVVVTVVVLVLLRRSGKFNVKSGNSTVHYVKGSDAARVDNKPLVEQFPHGTKPFIEQFPESQTAVEGKTVLFPVVVTGTPPPTITWYHDDSQIHSDYAHDIASDGSLTIYSAEMKHAGVYKMVAAADRGRTEEQTLKLSVKRENVQVTAPPLPVPPAKPPKQPVEPPPRPAAPSKRSPPSLPKPYAQPAVPPRPAAPSYGDGGIQVSQFGVYVAQNHSNTNKGFRTIYSSLKNEETDHAVTVAVTPGNKPLNRFNNITVYDDNRITLQPTEGRSDCQNDYINACYINGYNFPNKYIATQGPLSKTLTDFWRLIWQERSPIIVMVTNLKESDKVKCQQYWPDVGSQHYGPFVVTNTDRQVYTDYIIRQMQVELPGYSSEILSVTQYHFTSWPDHGVPEYATPILTFHRRVKQEYKPSLGPMLVHCSAGVGRTGTFIAIDTVLEQAEKEGLVDISAAVTSMRQKRMKMVQTAEQFTFIHDAVLESVTCGDTQISTGDLRSAIHLMQQRNSDTNKTPFEVQFEVLSQVTPNPNDVKREVALHHPDKNRSADFLPPDKHRVTLKGEIPDYIHATYVNGYKHRKAFVVAQNPMENTARDFLKMLIDRNCGVIVTICSRNESQDACYQFWPAQGVQVYNDVSVKLEGQEKHTGYVERKMIISLQSDTKQVSVHEVTQLHIQNWNPQGKCTNMQTIIAVVEEVIKVQRRTGNNPIVVHCSDSVSRSGMFCAIAATIDCCKTESVVDVFQVVKAQRIQKPGLVLTVEQYRFVFQAMLSFFESFDTYSNFQ